jgi:hypothetical protein
MATKEELKWMEAWRYAAPELEKIRIRELRSLSTEAGAPRQNNSVERCGLEDFQQWMMRWQVQQCLQKIRENNVG